ncbi:MAG: hypothetical protein QS748_14675, partial [Candidatus Endonucleobacter bathymodioli]|nr:hypothetical protein [Candidatus Endonucleobacter bathymodioli]
SYPAGNNTEAESMLYNNTKVNYSSNLNSSQGVNFSNGSEAFTSDVINISNVTEPNLIGNYTDDPQNGSYELTTSFSVKTSPDQLLRMLLTLVMSQS